MIITNKKGELVLDELTLDEIRRIYDLRRCQKAWQLEDEIFEAQDELESLKYMMKTDINYHNHWIERLTHIGNDPKCKDKSVIVNNIRIHEAEIKMILEGFEVNAKHLESRIERLTEQKNLIKISECHRLRELRRYAADKFHRDIAKPKPHPCRIGRSDPLYHDLVTDYVKDSSDLEDDD